MTIAGLLRRGARVVAHDPAACAQAQRILRDAIEYRRLNYDVLDGADALIIHTEWNPYRRPDFERMRTLLKRPIIIDGRSLYDAATMRSRGFEYHSVGRPAVRPNEDR